MFHTRLKEKEKTAKGMEKATIKAMAKEAMAKEAMAKEAMAKEAMAKEDMAKEEKEKARSLTWTGMNLNRG